MLRSRQLEPVELPLLSAFMRIRVRRTVARKVTPSSNGCFSGLTVRMIPPVAVRRVMRTYDLIGRVLVFAHSLRTAAPKAMVPTGRERMVYGNRSCAGATVDGVGWCATRVAADPVLWRIGDGGGRAGCLHRWRTGLRC